MISDEMTIEKAMERSEQILQVLSDTFGDDHPLVEKALERYTQIVADGDPINYKTAATYLEWSVAYPKRVGNRRETVSCRCDNKWILENVEENRYRPCPKCLPEAHDKWVGRSFEQEPEDEPSDRMTFDDRD